MTRLGRPDAALVPHPQPPAPGFTPIRLLDIEISEPLPAVEAAVVALDGTRYRRAQALVRLHGRPLGTVDLDLDGGVLGPSEVAAQIWRAHGAAILAHRARDGDNSITALPAQGLGTGPCREVLPLPDPPLASVVVATRDRPDAAVACVDRLLGLTYPRYEILVVDNAPKSDATAEALRQRYRHRPHVRYCREDRAGLSNARNKGLVETSGEIVAFTDDDVLVEPGWLTNLVAAFGLAPHVACVTGLILPAELETPAQLWLEEYGGFAKGYERQLFDLGEHRAAGPLYPYTMGQFGSGASLAFKAAALRNLGGFAAELGAGTQALGGEDLDIFFRVLMSGGAVVYEPGAILRHAHRRDYEGLRRQMHSYGVGLAAALTKCLVDRPMRVFDLARRVPAGLSYLLRSTSPKNERKRVDFPKELTRLERRGLLAGPARYLRSRREQHKR